MNKPIFTYGLPSSEVLEALGRLIITQGHLEYELKLTIKSLLGISIKETLQLHNKTTGNKVRQKVQKIAEEKLGVGETFDQLMSLIMRAWSAANKRNEYVHNVWARVGFNQLCLMADDLSWRPAPSKEVIDDLIYEVSNILALLTQVRLQLNK